MMAEGNYNCFSNDYHHQHVYSSSNPNATTSFEASPLEVYNFDSQNSVSHNSDFFHFEEPSLHVFPSEPNERPTQGLYLSLSSTNPSAIELQSFVLARPQEHNYQHQQHQGYFGKSMSMDHDMMMQTAHYNIRSSRYLLPTQELLNEFCNLGSKLSDQSPKAKAAVTSSSQWQDHDHNLNNASSSMAKSLSSLELMELEKRKTMLLKMLEEVDRRYKQYCDQTKAVVSSFEAVAGQNATRTYSSLASNAMSKHFRRLRDEIVSHIKKIKVLMREKDVSAPGSSRGETPRLRVLDQTLRRHRAFQQMNMMDNTPWRPQRGLPEHSVSVLRAWLFEHFLNPYPNDVDKHILAQQAGLTRSQVSNWFINARVRLWKPMIEEMYMEEMKTNQVITMEGSICGFNQNPQTDQKPTVDELVRIDTECLSSIINHNGKMDLHKIQDHDLHHGFPRVTNSFGTVEMDFSTYNDHHNNIGGGVGGGVSLTLGLHQHDGRNGGVGGVRLGFSPITHSSMFYHHDHMEDCPTSVQYSSLLEGDDQGQNLPYRDLMGAQLLHDLAG